MAIPIRGIQSCVSSMISGGGGVLGIFHLHFGTTDLSRGSR